MPRAIPPPPFFSPQPTYPVAQLNVFAVPMGVFAYVFAYPVWAAIVHLGGVARQKTSSSEQALAAVLSVWQWSNRDSAVATVHDSGAVHLLLRWAQRPWQLLYLPPVGQFTVRATVCAPERPGTLPDAVQPYFRRRRP